MTNLNLILIAIIWIMVGIFLAHKQFQCVNESFDADESDHWIAGIILIVFAPLTLLMAIIRQVGFEKWR